MLHQNIGYCSLYLLKVPKFFNERTLLQSTINGIQFPAVVIPSPVLHHFSIVFICFLLPLEVVNMEELKNTKQKTFHNITTQGNYILLCLLSSPCFEVSEIGMQVIINVYI